MTEIPEITGSEFGYVVRGGGEFFSAFEQRIHYVLGISF